jgi:tetratricopeptide (TPR) repeat protein
MKNRLYLFGLVALLTSAVFYAIRSQKSEEESLTPKPSAAAEADPLKVVLTPIRTDCEISALQARISDAPEKNALLERLGWMFVSKARLTSDPGYYTLAEQTAKAISAQSPDDQAAALLRGHVCHAMHRFAEAEQIARSLTMRREFVFDYALLGDALMEQGNLNEAVIAYQKMIDLKPCLQTYSRVAHIRWLKGDLPGALEASRLATAAGSPREPESAAWACTRLALYQLQANDRAGASLSLNAAMQFAPDYAPALLARGRLLLCEGKNAEAAVELKHAAEISPLPEYLWTASEALRGNGDNSGAEQLEAKLTATGARNDPRTFSVFLASRGESFDEALRLAAEELNARKDVFSYDALAWAQFAAGETNEARANIARALAEGTKDARLFLHAGAIAAAADDHAHALEFLNQAHALEQMLLPSERASLHERTAMLTARGTQLSSNN